MITRSLLPAARRDPRLQPWTTLPTGGALSSAACVICGWRGSRFEGFAHCESARCPSCGSIARDRFLYHCFVQRVRWRQGLAVLETSPRLGEDYRDVMASRMAYRASDFDQAGHRTGLAIDLQDIDLPDGSLDVILTPHVLEHIPDTARTLAELHRVLRPGGTALVQVPLLQPATAAPVEPEYHEDRTLVHWRFGVDLTERMRRAGFGTSMLVTDDLARRVARGDDSWDDVSPEFDAGGLVRAMHRRDLVVVASDRVARQMGFVPSYMFVTWECRRPA